MDGLIGQNFGQFETTPLPPSGGDDVCEVMVVISLWVGEGGVRGGYL